MKATKKNLIKYLEASIDNCHNVANIYKRDGDEVNACKYIREACALRDVIYCLTNDEYFTKQYNIMIKEDK